MRIGNACLAELEDRGGEDNAGVAFGNAFDQLLQIADATARDHGDCRYSIFCIACNRARQGVEQVAGPHIGWSIPRVRRPTLFGEFR